MFNNTNSSTNGEEKFYNSIKDNINIIFDVGCRVDSIFTEFDKVVHYFEPNNTFYTTISNLKNNNSKSYFNNFGLSNTNEDIFYYPSYESFLNRTISCSKNDDANKIMLKVKTASSYIEEHNIENIDFLKIDTEGFELNVLHGFKDHIKKVKFIQFEYGGTFLDSKVKLLDVVNYLKTFNFINFSYLTPNGFELITDFTDHYKYCNIVCFNS